MGGLQNKVERKRARRNDHIDSDGGIFVRKELAHAHPLHGVRKTRGIEEPVNSSSRVPARAFTPARKPLMANINGDNGTSAEGTVRGTPNQTICWAKLGPSVIHLAFVTC